MFIRSETFRILKVAVWYMHGMADESDQTLSWSPENGRGFATIRGMRLAAS